MKFHFTRGAWASKKARKTIKTLRRDDIKSIAVIRHAALGDMLLTRSFLVEARKAFPQAKITLSIISKYTRGAPEDLVDRIHIVEGRDRGKKSVKQRIRNMKELGYHDLIFDLATSARSVFTCLLNPAKLTFGFPYRKIQARLIYDVAVCRSDLNFEVIDMLNMLHAIGVQSAYPHQYNMPKKIIAKDKPYIVYFPGASTPLKCWPIEKLGAVIDTLSDKYPQYEHILLEGILDWEKATKAPQHIFSKANVKQIAIDDYEKTSEFIMNADMVVSNDTGIRHLAIVSEVPTVGIFYGDPYRYWPRYGIHEVALLDQGEAVEIQTVLEACDKVLKLIAKQD